MAQGQLPLYYKSSKVVGPGVPKKRWKEYYLLVVTMFGFLMLYAGVLWYVPSVEEGDHLANVYSRFAGPPTDITETLSELPLPESVNSTPSPRPSLSVIVEESQYGPVLSRPVESTDEEEEEELHTSTVTKVSLHSNNPVLPSAKTSASIDDVERKRQKVVEMAKHAWKGYAQYAWGDNELKPVSKRGHSASIFGKNTRMGATIVDSLDTLYLMGLTEEFEQAKEWVRTSLDLNQVRSDVSVFEFNIRFAGGILSAYALTGDEFFKAKAVEIVDKLMPAFKTSSGIPKSLINFGTGATKNWGWASGGSSILSEFGSLHLEFQYLTHLTGNPIYLDKVNHIRKHLQNMQKTDGLYPNFLNPNTGRWGTRHISLGALGDSFYEYLLKSWLMTSKHDVEARDMYYAAVEALEKHLLKRANDGTLFISDVKNGRPDNKMQHLACFAGGMFALGGVHATNGQSQHYIDLGKDITSTCHLSYARTATKLGPEAFRFDGSGRIVTSRNNEKMYLLRPETVESYFIMWRVTHDPKYREWGWDVIQALERNCRVPSGGYSGIRDVYNVNAPKDDVQQSFIMAETLKYLWLLFSDDDVLSLDQWVFNTEAHPFPMIPGIPGKNLNGTKIRMT